jgi:pilus assembly protein CpaB
MDRQKKLLLFGAAWVSALLLTWFYYSNAVAPKQVKTLRMVVAMHDMPIGTLLKKSDLKLIDYPEKDVPKGSIFQIASAESRVLMTPLNTNQPVLQGMLSEPTTMEGVASTIDRGYRAVSVQVTDVSGVAGLIQPGSHVDVIFTQPGSMVEAATSTILQNVKVISTGRTVAIGQTVDPRAPKSPTVTLVLLPADAQKLELAKSQGKISLSLRNPLDSAQSAKTDPVTAEVLDPTIGNRLARARRGRNNNAARNPGDPAVWQELTDEQKRKAAEEEARRRKAELEKPRVVVDVYRGDKHVQESFR